jgi:hypothetical protein
MIRRTRAEQDLIMMKWRRTLRRRTRRHHRGCTPGCPFAPWAKTQEKLYRDNLAAVERTEG